MNPSNYSDYYTPRKVVIGKHWKRPKPRVYECNVRDVERFYQESYKDYLDAKEEIKRKQRVSEDRGRALDRMAMNFQPEYRRTATFQDSYNALREPDPYLSRNIDPDMPAVFRSANTFSRQFSSQATAEPEENGIRSYRAKSMMATTNRDSSPGTELEDINEKLAKLKKLREELGLPPEVSTPSKPNTFRPSSPVRDTRPARTRFSEQRETTDYSRRAGGRSGGFDFSAEPIDDKYSSRTESRYSAYTSSNDDSFGKQNGSTYTSRFDKKTSSAITDDSDGIGGSKYERKTRQKVTFGGDDDEYNYTPPTSRTSTRLMDKKTSSYASTSAQNGSLDADDDEEILSIRKKFPTSDEIMERIKKMDVDV